MLEKANQSKTSPLPTFLVEHSFEGRTFQRLGTGGGGGMANQALGSGSSNLNLSPKSLNTTLGPRPATTPSLAQMFRIPLHRTLRGSNIPGFPSSGWTALQMAIGHATRTDTQNVPPLSFRQSLQLHSRSIRLPGHQFDANTATEKPAVG